MINMEQIVFILKYYTFLFFCSTLKPVFVFIPDKDSLFFLEKCARSFITAFNAGCSGLLVPVFPFYFEAEGLSETEISSLKNTFSGCSYGNIIFDGTEFSFHCDIEIANRTVSSKIVFARLETDSESAACKMNEESLCVLKQKHSPKIKSRILRSVNIERNEGSWTFYNEVFYKRKN